MSEEVDEANSAFWRGEFSPEAKAAKEKYFEEKYNRERAECDAQRVRRVKWKETHKGRTPSEVDAYTHELKEAGMSYKDIAYEAGVTPSAVYFRVSRYRKAQGGFK